MHRFADLAGDSINEFIHADENGLARARRDDFDDVAGQHAVFDRHDEGVVFDFFNHPGKFPIGHIGITVIAMCIIGQAAIVECQRIATVRDGRQFLHIFFGRPVFRIFVPVINRHAIGTCNEASVIGAFAAAFYLEAIDTDFQVIFKFRHDAKIARIQDIRTTFVFLNFHQFARTHVFFKEEVKHFEVFFGQFEFLDRSVLELHVDFVFPAARIGTCTLICAAFGHEVRQQATPGIGHAHRAMHEGLDLDVLAFSADFGQFLVGNLAA